MKSLLAGLIAAFLSLLGTFQSAAHIAPPVTRQVNAPPIGAARPSASVAAAATALATTAQQNSTPAPASSSSTLAPINSPAPAISARTNFPGYVTQSELDSRLASLSGLTTELQDLVAAYQFKAAPQFDAVAQNVAAGGNSAVPFAGAQNISQLSNVTISSPTIVSPSVSGLSTSQVSEGDNLYYTDARVGSYLSASTTIPHISGGAYGDLLSWNGSAWTTRATSTLAVNTSDLVEGSNLFFTTNRVASVIAGTTTSALAEGSNLYFTNNRVAAVIAGTTTDALREGASNLYWTNTRFDNRLSATTSLPNLTTVANLAAVGTITSGTWNGTGIDVAHGGIGWSAIQSGFIPFGNGSSALATSSSLFWDNANGRLGIGNISPTRTLDVAGTGAISTSLAVGGANISSNAFAVAGNSNVGTGGGDTVTLAGATTYMSGATGQVKFWDGASVGWTNTNNPVSSGLDTTLSRASAGVVQIGTTAANALGQLDLANLLASASSTIGNGTQTGGLTISGGATTTGNAYFGGNVAVTNGQVTIQSALNANGSFDLNLSAPNHNVNLVSNGITTLTANNGNVGIGTSTPATILDIKSASPTIALDDSANGTAGISWRPVGASYAERGALTLNTGTGEMRQSAGAGGNSYFQTWYTNGSERMRIDSSGNIGIGTTSPSSILHVEKDTNGAANVLLSNANTGSSAQALFQAQSNQGNFYMGISSTAMDRGGLLYTDAAFPITFWTNNAERMRIDASGNVGIATTTPPAKLSIEANDTSNTVNYISFDTTQTDAVFSTYSSTTIATPLSTKATGNLEYVNLNPSGTVSQNVIGHRTHLNVPDTNTAAISSALFGNQTIADYNGSGMTGTLVGMSLFARNMGQGSTLANVEGLAVTGGTQSPRNQYSTTTNAYAILASPTNISPNSLITNKYGVYVNATNVGTVTNDYGFYATGVGAGTHTTAYDFYAADSGANSYFAGNVGIGTTTPSSKLELGTGGNITLANNTLINSWLANGSAKATMLSLDSNNYVNLGGASAAGTLFLDLTGERARLVGGALMIGTTTSDAARLQVAGGDSRFYGNSSQNEVGLKYSPTAAQTWWLGVGSDGLFSVSDRFGNRLLNVTETSGNVGIGTTTPGAKLEIFAGTGNGGDLQIAGDVNNTYLDVSQGLVLRTGKWNGTFNTGAVLDNSGNFHLGFSGGGITVGNSYQGTTPPANGAIIQGNVGIGGTPSATQLLVTTGAGSVAMNGLWVTNSPDTSHTALQVQTNWSDGSGGNMVDIYNATSHKFVINNSGNVGIGKAVPEYSLDIEGSSAETSITSLAATQPLLKLKNTNSTVGNYEGIFFADSNDRAIAGIFGINNAIDTGDLAFMTRSGSRNEVMRLTSGGNVGIGTTTPISPLTVNGTLFAGSLQLTSGTDATYAGVFHEAGNAVVAVTAGNSSTAYLGMGTAASRMAGGLSYYNGNNSLTFITNSGQQMIINASGNAGVAALAAGTSNSLCYNTTAISGMNTLSTCSSDARLKQNITALDASTTLAQVMELNPVSFNWNPQFASSMPLQFGLIAQQVAQIWPNLVSTTSPTSLTPDGTLSLNFNGLFGPIIAAIQALDRELSALENTVAGFAESFTTKELTFTRATGDELDANTVKTQTLCVGNTCVTEDQLKSLLAAANAAPASGQGSGTSASLPAQAAAATTRASASTTPASEPPVIQINGDNPAHIQVGASYADLGAIITGPQADLNLGIKAFLNGALVSDIVLDTSAAATDTIDYVVSDANGLTSTSTRTVVVEAQQISTDTAPSETATTTVATTTAQ